jgi:adenosylhomocysteine nucleosidase
MNNVLITAALETEFPFKNEFPILYTGVGKVNATFSLCSYLKNNPSIELVINVGSAGGLNEKIGSIIECGTFIDGQLSYPGYIEEHIVYKSDKKTCLTFDNFVTEMPKNFGNCIDMESFALAKTCYLMGINFLCFKYISDIIGENNQENKWVENHKDGKDLLRKAIINIL